MNFIKRFYDKIILLGLFALFIGLMLYVLLTVEETKVIKASDLKLPQRKPDHVCVNPDDPQFNHSKMVANTKFAWDHTVSSEGNADLIAVAKLAVCPHCALNSRGDFKTLIPFSSFGSKCPQCGNELPKPLETQINQRIITANDSDGDGVSNDDERKYGMNPEDERDANYDMDGDGFSNRYEIANKHNPNNAADHPPLWHRLRVADIKTIELPIKLMVVNPNNSTDKSKWDIQYNLPKTRRGITKITSNFVALNDEIEVDEHDKRRYRIVDVRPLTPEEKIKYQKRIEKQQTATDGVVASKEKFLVELVEVLEPDSKLTPDKLQMVSGGEPVLSSDLRPIFQDTGRPGAPQIIRRVNAEIVLNRTETTSRRGYRERYRIVECDPKTKHVKIAKVTASMPDENAKEEIFVITPEGKVPREDWVVVPSDSAAGSRNE